MDSCIQKTGKGETETRTSVKTWSNGGGVNKEAGPSDTDNSQAVAKHYNELQETGLEIRKESRIFYMRNFNNWIKSVLIGETLQRLKQERPRGQDIAVLDLCSGKGGDLQKWKKGGITSLVCADIAETSVKQSEARYDEMVEREKYRPHQFTAEFITADCSKTRLTNLYKNPKMKFDLCSCQFSFHYSFESQRQVEMMLRNAVEDLTLGGYFIGTTPNSQELVRRLREADGMSFGNDVYSVTFDGTDKDELPLFGARYMFHLEGVVDCPEFLVYFPLLEKMAEKFGMKLIFKHPFTYFYSTRVKNGEHRSLLNRMQALEQYPPNRDSTLTGNEDRDYNHAKARLEMMKQAAESVEDNYKRRTETLGTLSKAEWEAISLYCVFMFQKVQDTSTGEVWQPVSETSRKRPPPADTQPVEDRGEIKQNVAEVSPSQAKQRKTPSRDTHADGGTGREWQDMTDRPPSETR